MLLRPGHVHWIFQHRVPAALDNPGRLGIVQAANLVNRFASQLLDIKAVEYNLRVGQVVFDGLDVAPGHVDRDRVNHFSARITKVLEQALKAVRAAAPRSNLFRFPRSLCTHEILPRSDHVGPLGQRCQTYHAGAGTLPHADRVTSSNARDTNPGGGGLQPRSACRQ